MKMSQVVTKLHSVLSAATSTYLRNARVYKYDWPATQDGTNRATLRLLPLPCKEGARYMGRGGFYVPFRVHIEARLPDQWSKPEATCDLCDEILAVLVANRTLDASSGEEPAAIDGESGEWLQWDYGFTAQGEQGQKLVNVVVTYTGPSDVSS